jgi:hypothetical protein
VCVLALALGCGDEDQRGLDSLSGASVGSTADPDTGGSSGDVSSGESSDADVPAPGEPTTFRIDSLTLVDPHVYAVLVSMDPEPPCIDGTVFLNDELLGPAVTDGSIDIVAVFPAFDMDAPEIEASLFPAECEPPDAPTMCGHLMPPETGLQTTVENEPSGECYRPDPATLGMGYTVPNAPSSPCFTSLPGELTLPLPGLAGGTMVVLQDVQFSATYADAQLIEGVLVGFATQAEAEVTVLDDGQVVMGGATLWQVIAGGDACETTVDDTDVHPEHGTGAWIYFDFTARSITWTG